MCYQGTRTIYPLQKSWLVARLLVYDKSTYSANQQNNLPSYHVDVNNFIPENEQIITK